MAPAGIFRLSPPGSPSREGLEIGAALVFVTALGVVTGISSATVGHCYLLVLIVLSLRVSLWPFLGGAVAAGALWNFVFVPPHLAFSRINAEDATLLAAYLTMAFVGQRLSQLRTNAERERLLEESEKLHNALFDNISHELKTPVSVLRSAVEQIGGQARGGEHPLFAEIQKATARLERLVHNLVSQTRIESGVLKPRLDWCEAEELIAEARRACDDRLQGRPVRIVVAPDMPLIFADAMLMEQSLANLLINAAVHTPAGSEVLVEAGVDRAEKETFLRVSDHGPGIPPELTEVVFHRFQGGKLERKSGLGLGLSIVKGFIEAQGGRAYATSNSGAGASFTVALPLRKPPGLDL